MGAEELNDFSSNMQEHVVRLADLIGGRAVQHLESPVKKGRMRAGFSKVKGFLPGLPKGNPAGG